MREMVEMLERLAVYSLPVIIFAVVGMTGVLLIDLGARMLQKSSEKEKEEKAKRGKEEEIAGLKATIKPTICRHCGERNYVKYPTSCQGCGKSIDPVEGVPWAVGAGEAIGMFLAVSGLFSGLLFSLRGWWWASLIGVALFVLSFALGEFFIAREQRELKEKFPKVVESG